MRTHVFLMYSKVNMSTEYKVKNQYAGEKIYNWGIEGGPSKFFLQSSAAIIIGELLQNKMTGEKAMYGSDSPNEDCNVLMETELIWSSQIWMSLTMKTLMIILWCL